MMHNTIEHRRQRMLTELISDMRQFHRRRRIRRKLTAAATMALLAIAATFAWSWSRSDQATQPSGPIATVDEFPIAQTAATIELVQTDPTITSRWRAARSQLTHINVVDDQSLLQVLAQMHRPAGLVRMDDRAWLFYHQSDAEDAQASPDPTGG